MILFIVVTDFQLTLLPMRLYFRFPLNLHIVEEPLGGETIVSHLTRADSGSREQPESPGKKPTVGPTNLAIPSTFELDSYGHHDIFREYFVGTAMVYDWDGKRTKFVVAARVAAGLCLAAFAAALPLLMLG